MFRPSVVFFNKAPSYKYLVSVLILGNLWMQNPTMLDKKSNWADNVPRMSQKKSKRETTGFPVNYNTDRNDTGDEKIKKNSGYNSIAAKSIFHFLTLFVLGLILWGLLWCAFGDNWRWDGPWFRLAAVAVVAWSSGQLLHGFTTLPPLLAALLTGILARNFNILDMRDFIEIDAFLRKVYPVLILGKASLGWDVSYIRENWQQISVLGVIPWAAEVVTVMICTNLLLGFPWIWGLLLGSLYASVSCAIVMPSVCRISASKSGARNWAQLICTAGGTDTALSVGVYGLIYSYIFVEVDDTYKYIKAGSTLLVGVTVGVIWGSLAGLLPHTLDFYVAEMRVLFVLLGGLFGNFFSTQIGWGGVGGVAVLACNATAATFWRRDGWKLNNNTASTAYRVLYAAAEPMVFAYSATFIVLNSATWNTFLYGLAILAICLCVRLTVTALVCWDMTLKERLFVCCTWTPKSIVEAVLCPVATNTLLMKNNHDKEQLEYAEDLMRLIVQAILITTPIGFLLTNHLGSWLLKKTDNESEIDPRAPCRKSFNEGSQIEDVKL
ncbi:sodium/hydrogen exchanger 9B1-like [Hyposmocoma kahamanoa]|uniref:sodium/hydrogen exchanger 9B1-like n=1 Tax=Hyposmocoma kahamanoa TaxID=1477025 RepID=UPI000E6D8DCF|nr:sodium/hydrogen exchanger 9B1-like [Hyposmocoma kahamanoa]